MYLDEQPSQYSVCRRSLQISYYNPDNRNLDTYVAKFEIGR